jgi:hypothetical protein
MLAAKHLVLDTQPAGKSRKTFSAGLGFLRKMDSIFSIS